MPVIASLANDIETAMRKAMNEALRDVCGEALAMSSGTLSYADLRAMDHPYAVRHGSTIVDPSIINKHRGDFYDHWREGQALQVSDGVEGRVINDSDVADFLRLGTSKMVPRPIQEALEDYAGQTLESRIAVNLAGIAGRDYT